MDSLLTKLKLDIEKYETKASKVNTTRLRKTLLELKKLCDSERKRILIRYKQSIEEKKNNKTTDDKKLDD